MAGLIKDSAAPARLASDGGSRELGPGIGGESRNVPGGGKREGKGREKDPSRALEAAGIPLLGVITPKPPLTRWVVQGDPVPGLIFCSEFSFSPTPTRSPQGFPAPVRAPAKEKTQSNFIGLVKSILNDF